MREDFQFSLDLEYKIFEIHKTKSLFSGGLLVYSLFGWNLDNELDTMVLSSDNQNEII